MKTAAAIFTIVTLALASVSSADAKGCIKGAIIGGAAGHLAHHGVLGAAAGCIIGHHQAKVRERAERSHAQEHRSGQEQTPAPSY